MVNASYAEIKALLAAVPAAQEAWADVFFTARLSVEGVMQMLGTMASDLESPIRVAEAGELNKEIKRLNMERGMVQGSETSGKMTVGLKSVVSPMEQTSVIRSVSGFCQPQFRGQARFSSTGHTVANAVRRAVCAYLMVKPRVDASVLEVGPDVGHWIVSGSTERWRGKKSDNYKGARPIIGPRDSVRMDWVRLLELVKRKEENWSDSVRQTVDLLSEKREEVFPSERVQQVSSTHDCVLSVDANYDLEFADMPKVMIKCGAKAWHGCMLRAKAATRQTKVEGGELPLVGMHYRIDWPNDRIDFRHPKCAAFGYSHKASQYLMYEEHNGYVWTAEGVHYVYSKGPETTDELLFFNVFRVPSAMHMQEPRYVEHPFAGKLQVESIWALGDEVNGVPTSFGKVSFHVDAMNFWKVLEKRKGLDYKGDLFATITLVRSTNVRFWLNGVPVGVGTKIESRLCEASAVAIEVLAGAGRLETNLIFSQAMVEYEACMKKNSWLASLLGSVVDLRMLTGTVLGSMVNMWREVRGALADAAVASVADVRVVIKPVPQHLKLDGSDWSVEYSHLEPKWAGRSCKCEELMEVRAAIMRSVAVPQALRQYEQELAKANQCEQCAEILKAAVEGKASKVDTGIPAHESCDSTGETDEDDGSTDTESIVASEVGARPSWSDKNHWDANEAKAMREFIALEEYLDASLRTELKIDASKVLTIPKPTDALVNEYATSRTKHMLVEFLGKRVVRTMGARLEDYGAVYVFATESIVQTKKKGTVVYADVSDGWHYTCNRLKVYNGPELVRAVAHALDYGVVSNQRNKYAVTIGVPGAGKTYGMMKALALRWQEYDNNFFVLAVTKASVKSAVAYGKEFGMPIEVLEARVMTLDRYLMHIKTRAALMWIDEFSMVHAGKIDAAISLAGAVDIRICGDGRQIPYDPFCAEFRMAYARFGRSVSKEHITFLGETHRCPEDVCAMWLDQYPFFYPCECCAVEGRRRTSLQVQKVRSIGDVPFEAGARYHGYKQEECDEIRVGLNMRQDVAALRAMKDAGLASVHEDQGSTHDHVRTVRTSVVFDKNASRRNPSLYNRVNYVLTDTTRHRKSYVYYTVCEEQDEVIKRIELSRSPELRALVRSKNGTGLVSLESLLD